MSYGSIGRTYHQLKYSSPNRSNKNIIKSHTKEPTFQKMKVLGKTDQENLPKAEKDKIEIAAGLGRRTRDDIYRKVGSNWQP